MEEEFFPFFFIFSLFLSVFVSELIILRYPKNTPTDASVLLV